MGKKLTETFDGDKDKQIETILKILYSIKSDSKFYFFSYGKDIIERYLKDHIAETSDYFYKAIDGYKQEIEGLKNHIESLRKSNNQQ